MIDGRCEKWLANTPGHLFAYDAVQPHCVSGAGRSTLGAATEVSGRGHVKAVVLPVSTTLCNCLAESKQPAEMA